MANKITKNDSSAKAEDNPMKQNDSPVKAQVIRYSVSEWASKAQEVFSVPPEVVTASFRVRQVEMATMAEAKEIVKTFLERKV